MRALIEINVFGGSTLLTTLKKYEDLPTGIYSDRPVRSLINLTPGIQANIKLQIETVSLNEDNTLLLVSDKRLQVTELLQTLGVQNFVTFIKDAERHGWVVEKYVDGINQYFHLDHNNQPMSAHTIFSENVLTLFLFLLMAATPAFTLKFMNASFILPGLFWLFALFLGLTSVVYFLSFSIMQYMRTRGEPIF
ncbi:hypothetical protein [Microbulbifer sp. THAF38]|uniref:hypothetical protein n=1 Tax=Microbulbifer sp. THAF38 TaxID=2587856 RepID=UPI001268778D|nr:hypothetical protein [Microbulbifer sp. THAF38]QFT57141.1 hypothetical protein FIU95_21550 [Microbulbifer sp. THAF38]